MERFWRLLVPGLVFQAVLVGGGYATGRELISFYISSGPLGGLMAMIVTTAIVSTTMMAVLEISRKFAAYDYATFFRMLIGPGWVLFEIAYIVLLILVLSIVGAAAGEITNGMSGLPKLLGTTVLVGASTVVLLFGSGAVKRVLSYWSVFLYLCYIAFFILFVSKLGYLSKQLIATTPVGDDVFLNGLRYAGVNINCFVSILFLCQQLKSRRESFISGALVGPLAMIPGILFYFAMMAFYPEIRHESVPLNFLLAKLNSPAFELLFQIAILGTLLQTGVGMLHSVNERVSAAFNSRSRAMPQWLRAATALFLMIFSITVADWIGLVSLIDNGYGFLSWVFILLTFVPVFTVGVYLLLTKTPSHQSKNRKT